MTLDAKLQKIRAGTYTPADFIIADAKDGDIAFGIAAPGDDPARPGRHLPRAAHLDAIREMVRSELVDIMLMSASTGERLSKEGLFEGSQVTPAMRLNDTTDIWRARGGTYHTEPSLNHRTARLDSAREYVDLGLYSITPSNQRDIDALNGEEYSQFREEATDLGMRHFLEVFNPSIDIGLADGADIGGYINDNIIRMLAGVFEADYPLFLKIQYNGPRAMEELASYDPGHLIVGILGGSKGTTRDTFELISQAERYGARVALFGRKIMQAEIPLSLVSLMRAVIQREVSPIEAVKGYHGEMQSIGVSPKLSLEDDLIVSEEALKEAADAA
ncbi:MAG: hypothetical protein AAF414_18155 [Pseudomonadota bacterium]